ncbi:MAG: DMT family transporter [Pseudomonadota bacterium]|nr:DMT family transporter [Pseudomonadota bacterium]
MKRLINLFLERSYSNALLGSVLIVFATLLFVVHDAIVKYLSEDDIKFYHFVFYGSPVYLALPLYLWFIGRLKENLVASNYFIAIVRGVLFVPLPVIAFTALGNISLPEFTTLVMCSPLFAVLFSLFILKENFNFFTIGALALGIIGVVFIFQPGFDHFSLYFPLVLVSACLVATTNLIVSKFHYAVTSFGFFIYGGVFVHLFSLILFFIEPKVLELSTIGLIIIASFAVNMAIFLFVVAFRIAQKFYGIISCLNYLQMLWAVLIGIVFFDEYLNLSSGIGAILIFSSGVMALTAQYRETKAQDNS